MQDAHATNLEDIMFIHDHIDLWDIDDAYFLAGHEDYWLPMLFDTPDNAGLRDLVFSYICA